MNRWFISDTHFSHRNIIKYENRPFKSIEEMDNILIEKWNMKVNKNDEVYHLGDFAFTDKNRIEKIIKSLNGKIHLIYGNHDKEIKHNRELQNLFVWCRDYFVINDTIPVVLFHYPIQVWDRKHHGSIHLYGHVHSNKTGHHPMLADLENAYNVGVDVNNFEPKSLEELVKR
jgi:calcineurin-like phosphoesterase family protein